MRQVIFAAVLAGLTGLTACSPNVSYTRSSTTSVASKPSDCQLEVLTVPPQRPFVELGTFDIENGSSGGSQVPSISKLVRLLRARACAEGADAIIGRKDDAFYVQATAVRWTEAAPAAPAESPSPQ